MRAPKTDKVVNQKPVKARETKGENAPQIDTGSASLLTMLERIATDEKLPPRERTVAARAVMEARGELGKHQRAPGDVLASRPLSDLSRPELEGELSRLRQHFAAPRLENN